MRRHRLSSGRLLLGLVDDIGYVRDTSSISVGDVFTDGSPGQVALVLRSLTTTLDLRRREELELCAVICRAGPVVWLPADLRCRTAVHDEARTQSLRTGPVFLLGDGGWRDEFRGRRDRAGHHAGSGLALGPAEAMSTRGARVQWCSTVRKRAAQC